MSQAEDENLYRKSRSSNQPLALRSWAANPNLFPTQLSEPTLNQARTAVKFAVQGWGQHSLSPLEAEDRLSVACEKGLTDDEVTVQLRGAFQVGRTTIMFIE